MGIDAGSIYSEVRIKLDKLKADITAINTVYDQFGNDFTNKAQKYSDLAGQKYVNSLKSISSSIKNIQSLIGQGALTEQEAVKRTLSLRQQELKLLENRAVKEGVATSQTISAISSVRTAISGLQQSQELLSKSVTTDRQTAQYDILNARINATTSLVQSGILSESAGLKTIISLRQQKLNMLEREATNSASVSTSTISNIQAEQNAISELRVRHEELTISQDKSSESMLSKIPKIASNVFYIIRSIRLVTSVIQGIIKPFQDSIKAWEDQEEAATKVISVFNSTGAAAWTTEQHILDLGKSLAAVTKFSDQEINSMDAVLLGFNKIQGINFDRATEAVLNVATVMKYDLTSSAQAVGKALEYPSQMLEGLRRQGFRFTDEQKTMIKTLEAAGNLEGAQNIILDELTRAYGGAARAVADTDAALKTMKDKSLKDLSEEIGRSITGSGWMITWRKVIKDLADGWRNEIKAQNDARDALKKEQGGGTLTVDENLSILTQRLKALNYEKETYAGFSTDVGYTSLVAEIAATEKSIQLYQAAAVARAKLNAATSSDVRVKAKIELDAADKAYLAAQAEEKFIKDRNKLINDYEAKIYAINDAANTGTKGQVEADTEILSLNQAIVSSLEDMKGEYKDVKDADGKPMWGTNSIAALAKYSGLLKEQKRTSDALALEQSRGLEQYEYNAKLQAEIDDTEIEELKKAQQKRLALADAIYLEQQYGMEQYTRTAKLKAEVDDDEIEELKKTQQARFKVIADAIALEQSYKMEQYTRTAELKAEADDDEIAALKEAQLARFKATEVIAQSTRTELENKIQAVRDNLKTELKLVGENEDAKKILIAKAEEDIAKIKADAFISTTETIISSITDIMGAYTDIVTQGFQDQMDALETYYDKQRELLENDGKTKREVLVQELADANALGDEKAKKDAERALVLFDLEQEFNKKKLQLQYESDMATWKAKVITATADAAMAVLKALNTPAPLNLYFAGLTGLAGLAQVAAVISARPQAPNAATGGVVLPRDGGSILNVAENKHAELLLNDSEQGDAVLQAFANKIAKNVSGSSTPVILQVVLKDKVIAESTVELINNGQVRLKR